MYDTYIWPPRTRGNNTIHYRQQTPVCLACTRGEGGDWTSPRTFDEGTGTRTPRTRSPKSFLSLPWEPTQTRDTTKRPLRTRTRTRGYD